MENKESDIIANLLCDIKDSLRSGNYHNANIIWSKIEDHGWDKEIVPGKLAASKGSVFVSIYNGPY